MNVAPLREGGERRQGRMPDESGIQSRPAPPSATTKPSAAEVVNRVVREFEWRKANRETGQ